MADYPNVVGSYSNQLYTDTVKFYEINNMFTESNISIHSEHTTIEYKDVVFGLCQYIVVGKRVNKEEAHPLVLTSTDGNNWMEQDTNLQNETNKWFTGICSGGGSFLVLAFDGKAYYIYSTIDGSKYRLLYTVEEGVVLTKTIYDKLNSVFMVVGYSETEGIVLTIEENELFTCGAYFPDKLGRVELYDAIACCGTYFVVGKKIEDSKEYPFIGRFEDGAINDFINVSYSVNNDDTTPLNKQYGVFYKVVNYYNTIFVFGKNDDENFVYISVDNGIQWRKRMLTKCPILPDFKFDDIAVCNNWFLFLDKSTGDILQGKAIMERGICKQFEYTDIERIICINNFVYILRPNCILYSRLRCSLSRSSLAQETLERLYPVGTKIIYSDKHHPKPTNSIHFGIWDGPTENGKQQYEYIRVL